MAKEQETTLLTLEERAICERVSITDQAPHNQRAQVLLALDEGLSQTEAGERVGLKAGQVKYWLNKFQQQRTGIFPEELLVQPVSTKTSEKEPKPEQIEETSENAQPTETSGKKTKKSKKAKGKKVKEKSSKKKKKDSKKKAAKKAKNKKKKDREKKKSKKVKKSKKK